MTAKKKKIIGGKRFFVPGALYVFHGLGLGKRAVVASVVSDLSKSQKTIDHLKKGETFLLLSRPRHVPVMGLYSVYAIKIMRGEKVGWVHLSYRESPKTYFRRVKSDE